MKHLIIKNFGPLRNVDIELSQLNLIIGLQSSGKSCVMMVACYCSWVEKKIILRQSTKEFSEEKNFIMGMVSYYRIKGYVQPNTYIAYSSPYMSFEYDNSRSQFTHKWNAKRWSYKRPKVSYVPAERNMISLISNWDRLETNYDNILDFKVDFDTAKKYIKKENNILGTGISYEYDESKDVDSIIVNKRVLELMNSSSGIQSLIPQFVHLHYLGKCIYNVEKKEKEKTLSEKQLSYNLLNILYERIFKNIGENQKSGGNIIISMEGKDFVFPDTESAKKFKRDSNNLLRTNHAEIFLEEPESNLFPTTQFQLMDMVVDMLRRKSHKNFFFIATHSPYVLNYLLQENIEDFSLFLTYPADGEYNVKTASESDIQEIYDNGADAFFNFDAFIAEQ